MTKTAYVGSFINPKDFGVLDYITHGLCVVDSNDGLIRVMQQFTSAEELETALPSIHADVIVRLGKDEFLIPGFVDMHTHAPQYRNLGLGHDYALLGWLEKITFPEEESYGKRPEESASEYYERIATIYGQMVQHYLGCGTTTCCYFGSLHLDANKILVDQIAKYGQRALVGKTCMDCNSPDNYIETTEESLMDTKGFVKYIKEKDQELTVSGTILPVVTPRFALTCTRESMKGLAEIARLEDVHIQSHMSENRDEISFAKKLFPECEHYAQVYESMGLLTDKTFMAHCVHMTDAQLGTLSRCKVAVSHCPTSNFALNSGTMDIRSMLSAGISVGLGSDVSGGYGLSILDAMRQAIIASKGIHFQQNDKLPLTVPEAFYLGTLGRAKALKLDDRIGSFKVGKVFDAILIDMTKCPSIRHYNETLQQHLQRLIFLGDDRWIKSVIVNGLELRI